VGTFPLAIYYFHQFPSYFLLSNFVIIPVAGLLIYGSALLLIFSEISIVSKALTYLLQHFVELIHWLIYQIQVIPGALLEHVSFTSLQVVLIYALIISLTISVAWRRKQAFLTSLVILIGFKLIGVFNLHQAQSSEMLVLNAYKQTVICIRDKQQILVLSDTILTEKQKKRLIYPYGMSKGVKGYSYDILKDNDVRLFNNKLIAVIGNAVPDNYLGKLDADYIIFRNNALRKKENLSEIKKGVIVWDASNYRIKSNENNERIWDTQNQGAYIVNL